MKSIALFRASLAAVVGISFGASAVADLNEVTVHELEAGKAVTVAGSGFGAAPRAWLRDVASDRRYRLVVANAPAPTDASFAFTAPAVRAGRYVVDVVPAGARTPVEVPDTSLVMHLPAVLSVSPAFGAPGTTVTVNGRFFGERAGRLKVGPKHAKVLEWTDTAITFVVPRLRQGPASLRILSTAGTSERKVDDFTVGDEPIAPRATHLRFTAGSHAADLRSTSGEGGSMTCTDQVRDGVRHLSVYSQIATGSPHGMTLGFHAVLPRGELTSSYTVAGPDAFVLFGPFTDLTPAGAHVLHVGQGSSDPRQPSHDVRIVIDSIADGFVSGSFRGTLKPTAGAADPATMVLDGTFRVPFADAPAVPSVK